MLSQIEFVPDVAQKQADQVLLDKPQVGQLVMVRRAGESALICRGGLAHVVGGNSNSLLVDIGTLLGFPERLHFWRNGPRAGAEISESWEDCWHVHALTARAQLFITAAETEFATEQLIAEVRFLAGTATPAQLKHALQALQTNWAAPERSANPATLLTITGR